MLLFFLFFSCKKPNNEEIAACGVENPIENLSWLNQKYKLFTGGPELNSVVLYEYNGASVIQINQSVSSKMLDLYSCDGIQLMINADDYIAKRKKIGMLYGTWLK